MNTPNPFVPQGSVLEHNKRRSRMKLAVFCVIAVSVCGLTAMLIQGCKREQSTENLPPVETNNFPPETNLPAMEMSNPAVTMPPMPSNPPVVAPVVPPVAPVAPEAAGTEYVVVKGDTLSKIAKAQGVTLKALENANPNVRPTRLKVGQKLTIPAGGAAAPMAAAAGTTSVGGEEIYVVKSGDTLTRIARTHGTTVKAIEAENNLSTTKIKVGQKLKMPASAAASVPAATPAPTPAPAPVTPEPMTPPASAGTPAGQ
jgi:LysM repeat protein